MKVNLDISDIEFLVKERISKFSGSDLKANLFWQMYKDYLENDINLFETNDFDLIVDNDWFNYCEVIEKEWEEQKYNDLLKLYEKGDRDISEEENKHGFSFIEAVDEYNGLILVRW